LIIVVSGGRLIAGRSPSSTSRFTPPLRLIVADVVLAGGADRAEQSKA